MVKCFASILLNNASNNTFESNILWANPNSTSTNTNYTISGTTNSISSNGVGSYNTLQNNLMVGGYYSVYMYGATAAGSSVGNVIHNNEMDSIYYYGSYIFYQDSLEYTNNTVDQATRGQVNGDGMYLYYSSNFDVSGNYIHAQDYGIYFYNFGANAPTLNGKNRVSNNMVISDNDWGMYFLYETEVDFFYNSVATYGTSNPAVQVTTNATNIIDNFDVRNNVFYSATTEAFEMGGIPDTIFVKMDNNVYYTGGSSLLNIDGTPYADLLSYQTARPAFNASSLDGDPQFLSTTDLHVIGSFINDGGDNSVPITVDIDGDTRPIAGSTTVDIGADEFDPPACPPSTGLGSTNSTQTSADIFWTGVTMDYQYEVVAVGAAQGTGTIVATTLDSVTVTGLATATSYDFYVREVCGRGDTSIWVGPFTFGTNAAFPYFEDFESGNGGWLSTGANSSWAWGVPSGTVISSAAGGLNAWVTNLAGNYNNGELSYIVSPSLDLSALTVDPVLSFSLTYETELNWDEGWVESSTDGGLTWTKLIDNGGALQWYNNVGNQYWEGLSSGGAGVWVNAENNLLGLGGQSSVRIRFVFSSDGSVNNYDGFGIDNVRIDLPPTDDAGVLAITSPVSGCALGSADSIRVQVKNFGLDTLTSVPVSFTINGGAAVNETIATQILPGDTLEYTFTSAVANLSTFGNYDFKAYTSLPGDAIATNDTANSVVVNIPLVSSFPYSEDFELSNGGWTASGANSTWAWGTPAGAVISSAAGGTGAWVTNLTGNYNNNEASFIESPCLDLSSLVVDPILTFSLTYDTESCCDEGWIDVSTDGGFTWSRLIDNGGAQNWYNDLFNQWWDGTSSGGAGVWVTAENVLTGLAGQSSVKIRIGFSSDGSVVREGFGIDDVNIDLPQAFNMALVDIVTPVSGAYTPGLTDSIRVTLANVGSDTATNFTVNYVLNGGPVVTETIASVLPGDTLLHVFNSSIALPVAGQADTLDVYVDFTADLDNSNDSILGYIFDNDIKGVPYVEDFENSYALGNVLTNQQGGWSSTRGNSPDWEIEDASGANENSSGTGPWYDRTTFNTAGGFYAYLECSGGTLGDQDTMRSPSILVPATAGPMILDYSYHMFGTDMGTLELFIEANGVYTRLDSVGGQIQLAGDSAWSDTSIALTGAFNGQIINIVFVGTRGNGFTSDMSIDDISLDFFVGVNENTTSTLEGISISPNPSNGLFKLSIETPAQENFNMTVRDAQGRSVYTANFDVNGTYRNDLDFTSFAKGVYYMQIQTETGSTVEKLIIQ